MKRRSLFGMAAAVLFLFAAFRCPAPALAQYLVVATNNAKSDKLLRFNGSTGAFIDVLFHDFSPDQTSQGLTIGPDGNLYLSFFSNGAGADAVWLYSFATGQMTNFTGTTTMPGMTVFGADGNFYVANNNTDGVGFVSRYKGATGQFIDIFVQPGSGGLTDAYGITFGPDGNLYVGSSGKSQVLRYNGQTGDFMGVFASDIERLRMRGQSGIGFGPDGNLYASSWLTGKVVRFNGTNGRFIDEFATTKGNPTVFTWNVTGNLYVAGDGSAPILRFDGTTGKLLSTFVPASNLANTHGVAFTYAHLATAPASVSCKPKSIAGGNTALGKVTLDGGAPPGGAFVALKSSDPRVLSVPQQAWVPTGLSVATFKINTTIQEVLRTVYVSATYHGKTKTFAATVGPYETSTVTLNPASVVGGGDSTGTVTMNGTVFSDTTVSLSTGNSAAHVPATVIVPAGSDATTFTVTTDPVAANTSGPISAQRGTVVSSATLLVKPPALSAISLSPISVHGGSTTTGRVTLNGVAAVDTVVSLTNANAKALLPNGTNSDTVTVRAGQATATFLMTTQKTSAKVTGAVTATLGGVSKHVTLAVIP